MTVRDGKVLKIEGEPDCILGHDYCCERAQAFIEHLYHPDRLNLYPQKTIGPRGSGKWERIIWNQALDEIAEKFKELKDKYGAETMASTCGTGRGHQIAFKLRFVNIFGSPNHAGGRPVVHV
ncbi:MAG: hypothetical protein DRG25_05075 [Deltaproteobacteria bacterium]|nr:MAG: hypothetical protein DRG25_05075 [Deltaproteobacteria bacterium]